MRNTFYSIITFFLLFSCTTEKQEITNTLCDNQQYLLTKNIDLPPFNFDLNINTEEHIEILKDSLKNNLNDYPNLFNWEYKDRIITIDIIPIHLMSCSVSRHELNLILNTKNQMLFDTELKRTDSVIPLVKKNYQSKISKVKVINVDFPYGLSKPIINDIVYDISEGYLKAVEQQSNTIFKKSICELTKEEIKILKEDNQIHIYFQSFSDQIEENHRIQEMININ
ncbi:hypothetical protein [Olleya sp. HaHaR_3_96]|uniref:hypothetical protein n=1 Tax=Olleya sp. HaHaR_3_96 TaxID=2745560 RepID=UPI001C4E6079|nr:hypothetical protein [Olleya sp. HaHaR_3_96]QXP59512.1 hypothetical protein H0I26_16585 [Olleya sp. HaHaR_3_96]